MGIMLDTLIPRLLQERRQTEVARSIDSLRMANKQIVGELSAIVKALLGKHTRSNMMAWLGSVIESNQVSAAGYMAGSSWLGSMIDGQQSDAQCVPFFLL